MYPKKNIREERGGPAGAVRRLVGLGLLTLVAAACEGLFDVENPTNLLDEDLDNPQLVTALSNAAEANLAGPYGSNVLQGEMLGDVVFHVSSQDFAILIDQGDRRTDNVAVEGMYNGIASARAIADMMVTRLQEMVPNPQAHPGVADSYFFSGIARMVMQSYFDQITYDAGPPVTPAQALRDAIERFQKAAQVAAAAGNKNLEAGSYGAIARAYRSLYFEELHYAKRSDPSLFQQAETFARRALDTRPDFRVNIRYGDPGPVNPHYNTLVIQFRHRPIPEYYRLPDPVTGQPDPRIKLSGKVDTGARGEPMHDQLKWTRFTDPVAVSRAAEAELIVAEARLLVRDLAGAVQWINRGRAKWGLAPFASTDADKIRAQLLHERNAELWLEGRAWEDHRYYEIVPRGWTDAQKAIGVHQRFPVSVQERNNNPHLRGS